MNEKKTLDHSMLACIFSGIMAVWGLIRNPAGGLLSIVAYAALGYLAIQKKKDKFVAIAAGVLTLFEFLSFCEFLTYGIHGQFLFRSVARILAFIGFLLLTVVNTTNYLQQYKQKINTILFAPAALIVSSGLIGFYIWNVIGCLLTGAMMCTYAMWLVRQNEALALEEGEDGFSLPKISLGASAEESSNDSSVNSYLITSEMQYNMVKHILLLVFTCGIWNCIWIYKVTGYTNGVKGKAFRNTTNQLLLCLFVPFYYIYWTYETAQRIDSMTKDHGIPSDLSMICLLLSIFVPIIPPILMQEKLNSLVSQGANYVAPQEEKKVDTAVTDTAERLRIYKELLDDGVITEEEFNAKKEQLLRL